MAALWHTEFIMLSHDGINSHTLCELGICSGFMAYNRFANVLQLAPTVPDHFGRIYLIKCDCVITFVPC